MSNAALKQMQFDALVELINERNEHVNRINAATGDKDSLAEGFRERPEFEELRNKIAELEEELDAKVKVLVDEALANKDDNSEELTSKVKELDEAVKPGLAYFKKIYGEEAAEDLPKVVRLKGVRTGGGGGGKRIRGYNWIVTMNGESTEYENAAAVAKVFGVDTKDIQEQFFAKAGVEKISDAPDEVVISVSFNNVDSEGNTTPVTAEIKAYRTGPSGVASKDEASDEAETEVEDTEEESYEAPDEDELSDL